MGVWGRALGPWLLLEAQNDGRSRRGNPECQGPGIAGLEWGAGWETRFALWVCGRGGRARSGRGLGPRRGVAELWDAGLDDPTVVQLCPSLQPHPSPERHREQGCPGAHLSAEKMGKCPLSGHSSLSYGVIFWGMSDRCCWPVFKTTKTSPGYCLKWIVPPDCSSTAK